MASLPAEKAEARPHMWASFTGNANAKPAKQGQQLVGKVNVYPSNWGLGPATFDRRDLELPNWGQRPSLRMSAKLAELGYCVKDGVIERLPEEKSWGAFEPFSYTERS